MAGGILASGSFLSLVVLPCFNQHQSFVTMRPNQKQSAHLAYTRTVGSYYMTFHSQSGKIKVYSLSFQSLFDKIHQGKYVL